jgi:hypothetical protein
MYRIDRTLERRERERGREREKSMYRFFFFFFRSDIKLNSDAW